MHSRKRHIAKTITWRVIASTTTFILTLLFFQNDPSATEKALGVAAIEATTKMILYYYHERVWYTLKLQVRSTVRHLFKTVTWRVIASITTFIIAFLIFKEDQYAMEKASGIAVVETFIKMLLYYLHERIWYKQHFGLESRSEK